MTKKAHWAQMILVIVAISSVAILIGMGNLHAQTPTQRLHFTTAHDLSKLHDELLAGIPGLRPLQTGVDSAGQPVFTPVMTVEGKGHNIWLTVSASLSQVELDLITTIVRTHDPLTAVSSQDAARQRFIDAVNLNKTAAPWGQMLFDLAVSQGLITE